MHQKSKKSGSRGRKGGGRPVAVGKKVLDVGDETSITATLPSSDRTKNNPYKPTPDRRKGSRIDEQYKRFMTDEEIRRRVVAEREKAAREREEKKALGKEK